MKITKQDVDYVARLARLALTEEEKERFTQQLGAILESMEKLSRLDTQEVPPTSHVLPLANVWRPDVMSQPFGDTEAILQNAPEREGPLFKVKKVIDPLTLPSPSEGRGYG